MRRALLGWEIGLGRGHVARMRQFAEALVARGYAVSAALRSFDHVRELDGVVGKAHLCLTLPYFHHLRDERGDGPAATFGEFLGDLGFFSSSILARHIGVWRSIIAAERPDVVVGEHAPCALLAARSMGLPTVVSGNTYTAPPGDLDAFPVMLPEFTQRVWDERALLAAVNAATAPFGLAPLDRLPQIYAGDLALVTGIPFTDPYDGRRRTPLLPPATGRARPFARGDGRRDEVFAYLSTDDRRDPALVDALMRLDMPRRIFAPGASPQTLGLLASYGCLIEDAPVAPRDIARRSRMLLHAGNAGTVEMGVRAGLPQLSAPRQLEQLGNARLLARGGSGVTLGFEARTAADYERAIRALYHDEAAERAALRLARATRADFEGDAGAIAAEKIAKLVG